MFQNAEDIEAYRTFKPKLSNLMIEGFSAEIDQVGFEGNMASLSLKKLNDKMSINNNTYLTSKKDMCWQNYSEVGLSDF